MQKKKGKKSGKEVIWEQRIPLMASFLIPLLLVLAVCIHHEVFPFGDQCILHIDMYHQYCPFFTELMEKLKTGGSLFYSWDVGLGADFISLYAYYLASPLNWLLLLCPRGYVIEFMTILVVLKIALCGLTFGYYLKMHYQTNHFAISIFATAYALSAFVATYAWNIMWMDSVALAPLAILGVERLIKEKKPVLYYISLSLCILSNYYIAIMVCIFLALWFVITWIANRHTGIGAWLRFAGYSLLAGGTGAILIIPEAVILGNSGSQNISFPHKMEWYFNIIAELGRHSVLTDGYTGKDHWPNIYCGVFVLLLFVMYLLNKEISWKRKLPRVLFLVLFVVSFSNNMLNFIWHGFHFPDSLPGRQTFLYAFLLLAISYEVFLHFSGNRLWHVAVAGGISAVLMAVAYYFSDEALIAVENRRATLILIGCYTVILLLYFYAQEYMIERTAKKKQKKKQSGIKKEELKSFMLGVGCFAMLAELLLNFDVTGLGTTTRSAYVKSLADYKNVLSQAKQEAEWENLYFYRTEELERKTKNDAALSGYHSATQFSSLMNLNVSHFYQAMGMEGGKNFYCFNGATPLLSAMLSVKYVLADNALEENPIRTMVANSGETYLYENQYSLPLGFMMSEDAIAAWDYSDMDEITAQNQLAYILGANDEMLTEIPSEADMGETTITVAEDGYVFATYDKTTLESLTEEVSDGRSKSFSKVSHGYTLDLGYCKAGSVIALKNTKSIYLSVTAYQLNLDAVDAAYQTLNQQTMEMTSFSDTKITGTIDVTNPGRLIFSIADEEGWTLYVDGKEAVKEDFGGAFIGVSLEKGTHEIMLKYHTPGFAAGAAVSGGCVAVFLALMWIRRRRTAVK